MSHYSTELTSETRSVALPKPQKSSRRTRRSRGVFALLALLLGAFPLFTEWPHYAGGTAVCQTCGMRCDYFNWNLRFTKATLHRFRIDNPTAVSRAFAHTQPAPKHEHDWTTPAALPRTGHEADETPPNLLYTVEAPRVARFAENLATYTNADTQTKWRRAILDPAYAAVFAPSLRFMRFPESGFADAAAFDRWWRQAQFPLWNRLRELTEPD